MSHSPTSIILAWAGLLALLWPLPSPAQESPPGAAIAPPQDGTVAPSPDAAPTDPAMPDPPPPMDPAQPPASAGSGVFSPPAAPDPARYQSLADPSPFTTRPSVDLAAGLTDFPQLTLIGLMSIGGKINAWVQPVDSEEPLQLVEGADPAEAGGLRLVRVLSPDNMFEAVAEIEAAGQIGQVRFTEASATITPGAGNPAAAQAQQAQAAAQAQQGIQQPPGQPQQQPGQVKPPQSRQKSGAPSTLTPRRRIILPR